MIRTLLRDSRKTLRLAGIFILIGLLVEAITLYFAHPFAFMGFIFLGGTMIGVGILLYLSTLINYARS